MWETPSRAYSCILRARSSCAVLGEITSHSQSGGSSKAATSGTLGMRSCRQPARSGTSTSAWKCSSGSKRIHHPPRRIESPGVPWKSERSCTIPVVASACGAVGRGLVNSSPPTISATRCSGTRARSSYVTGFRHAPPTRLGYHATASRNSRTRGERKRSSTVAARTARSRRWSGARNVGPAPVVRKPSRLRTSGAGPTFRAPDHLRDLAVPLLPLLDQFRDRERLRHGAVGLVLRPRLHALVEEPTFLAVLARVRNVGTVEQLHVGHDETGVPVPLLVVLRPAGERLGAELVVVDPHLPELAVAIVDVGVGDDHRLLVDEDDAFAVGVLRQLRYALDDPHLALLPVVAEREVGVPLATLHRVVRAVEDAEHLLLTEELPLRPCDVAV